MFVSGIKRIRNVIFPLFYTKVIRGSPIDVVGSGFFINKNGYFLSAVHLFDDTGQFLYYGRLPEEVVVPNPLLINEVARDDEYDVFVGKVEVNFPFLNATISNKLPEIGKSLCISGYPLATISLNQDGTLNLGQVRRYFQPSFVLDLALMDSTNPASGKTRTHDGFIMRDFGLFGMSGGPVFDTEGRIFGMMASVTPPRTSLSKDGESISVQNACIIRSNLLLEFLKKNNIQQDFLVAS